MFDTIDSDKNFLHYNFATSANQVTSVELLFLVISRNVFEITEKN